MITGQLCKRDLEVTDKCVSVEHRINHTSKTGQQRKKKKGRKEKKTTADVIQLLGGWADLRSYKRLVGSRSVL